MKQPDRHSMSPIGRYLFAGPAPPPAHLASIARPFVDRAKLTYKSFRADYERIGGSIARAKADGLLSQEDASAIWLDAGGVVSRPLIARYCEARQFDAIVAWLKGRPTFRSAHWLVDGVRFALASLVEYGEAARASALCAAHAERAMTSVRRSWKEHRNLLRRYDAAQDGEEKQELRRLIAEYAAVTEEMLLELAELQDFVSRHGSEQESATLAHLRQEAEEHCGRFSVR